MFYVDQDTLLIPNSNLHDDSTVHYEFGYRHKTYDEGRAVCQSYRKGYAVANFFTYFNATEDGWLMKDTLYEKSVKNIKLVFSKVFCSSSSKFLLILFNSYLCAMKSNFPHYLPYSKACNKLKRYWLCGQLKKTNLIKKSNHRTALYPLTETGGSFWIKSENKNFKKGYCLQYNRNLEKPVYLRECDATANFVCEHRRYIRR